MAGVIIRRIGGSLSARRYMLGALPLRQRLACESQCQLARRSAPLHSSAVLERLVSFHLSDIGEGIREVTVKEWYVKVGDVVEQFDNLCEVQSDKASVTITSRYDGKIAKLHHDVDSIALVGKPLLDFEVEEDDENDSSSSSSDDESESPKDVVSAMTLPGQLTPGKVLATPAVRRIAMEHKVDLGKVRASGRNGRVLKGDVLEYLQLIPQGTVKPHPTLEKPSRPAAAVAASASKISPAFVDLKDAHTVVPLKGIAKAMVKSMTEALKIPHFAYCDEIDVTKLVSVRNQLKEEAARRGVKLTYMPFFLKAASAALREFPILNSSYDESAESVIYKAYHNISVAMQTPNGLVVPNVKNVEQKSIMQIAADMNALQDRGTRSALTPDDFANGTFALSNIGIIGGTYTHPVVISPQVAIGGLGKTRVLPRFDAAGNVTAAHIMVVSWTADHRIIDGVTMASFSNLWKQYLENPNMLLLAV
ncbi:lipoamide acyltransferase component of branched-chain alpha-keto acid dehydrogenase complex, mitochondrial [Anopheles darlingi]|uniref:lipoamide acyltransferase component of branched-chain alpha-keto acid dehydrogenase complex, mitochondrial n=1 Tax=Anopheles darlingi TaxID=43151 RepID=UPI00210041AF|nr:lipoamide acyltransferase component of branched-chain alpha-keto acid dehydrogenase complex, mitochondrial [Anopheles darlingi]XP_049549017.1 lipoamide acyltransferase component of branched-chain alpha-keto acid dehydrogenase complex, mitochondrial [Anopheles darlingi]